MIVAMPVIIAALGIGLLLLLTLRIREVGRTITLNRFRSKTAGVADLINYASLIEDGIVICKNGSLMAAWVYRGEDEAAMTDERREAVAEFVNHALYGLGSGWMLHVDAIRRASPNYIEPGVSHFPDQITAAIEEERRAFFENLGNMYEGFTVLTVTYFPPLLAQTKFVELMFDDDGTPDSPQERSANLLTAFKRDIMTLESRLSTVLRLERLSGQQMVHENGQNATYDEFLQFLHFCITGIRQPIVLPSTPNYLDLLIGGQELQGGVVPRIGKKYIQVVAIEGFPLESWPGMLSILTDFDVEYRWSNRFIFLDRPQSIAHMDRFRRKWRQKQRGLMDLIFQTHAAPDADALAMTQDSEQAIAEAKSGEVSFGYYTSTIVLMNENRELVEAAARKLEKAIFGLGFAARIETINTLDAYFGSLPGHGYENVRRPLISTLNLAHFLPIGSIWTGDEHAPCPMYPPSAPALMYCVTTGHSPFRFNLHVRDLGHTLLFGPPGSGKSTALGLIIAQLFRYEGMTIFAFDKGLSLFALCSACGGQHIVVAGDDERLNFCPLADLSTQADQAWALMWLESMLALNGLHTSVEQQNEMADALRSMHETGGRTLTDFVAYVQDDGIRNALQRYTIGNAMGTLFDAEADSLNLSSFTVFEIEELLGKTEKYSLPVFLYLFRKIEKSLHGQPAAIILDEAWILLANEVFKEKIREWLKVLRKQNCIVIMATQNISDAVNSSIFDVIMESTATKIYLANVAARTPESAERYLKMNLNGQQISIIASMVPKREYYLVSDMGCRKFSFAIGKFAMAFVGVSDRETVSRLMELEKIYGPAWVDLWLTERNLELPTGRHA